MNRCAKTLLSFALLTCAGMGCANSLETRTIAKWMSELENEDLAQLRERSSNKFDELALPLTARAEPFEAMNVLNLPKGQIKVTRVVDDEENGRKKVEVEIGEKDKPKRTLAFTLVVDDESGRWLVDDVYQKERLRSGKSAYRSIAEQMNLLLAVQEFDHLWSNGDRADVLDSCTPRLARLLGELPTSDFDYILTSVNGKGGKIKHFKPKARMAEDTGEVTLHKNGRTIVIAYRNINSRWLVDNVAVSVTGKSRGDDDQIPSIQDLAAVLLTTNNFRTAYDMNDKKVLQEVCEPAFFEGALSMADLNVLPLPMFESENSDTRTIDLSQGRAEFVVRDENRILQISLSRDEDAAPNAPREYRVANVTIWEDRQEKQLAAVFTAHQSMQVYSQALNDRDLRMLDFLSTRDFRQRVWSRLTPETIYDLPLNDIPAAMPAVENSVYRGQLTEITVNQGGKPITYVMRTIDGEIKVDDVLFPADGRPSSLKQTAEILIPINDFAAGFRLNSLDLVARNSTRELNRMAWSQCRRIPRMPVAPERHLKMPLYRVENSDPENIQVVLGNQDMGAVVWLIKERDSYRVDDVRLIQGPDERRDQVQLKHQVRLTLAQGELQTAPQEIIVPADFDVEEDELFPESLGRDGGVQQAVGSEPALQ